MSYSGIAVAAIGLALLAVAVAVAAGVLLCLRRRRLAERLLPLFLALLVGGVLVSLLAVAQGPDDLQRQAQQTLTLASTAERAELQRFGHYTTSVARLARLSRSLEAELTVDGALVQVSRGPGAGNVTLSTSLGPGTRAEALLYTNGRLEQIAARPALPSRHRVALADQRRRTS
jgi:4-amino-4-deoxy-L-arabinose transferase-like glycosyltransferase